MVVEEFHDQKIIYHLNIDEEVNNILMHLSSLKNIKSTDGSWSMMDAEILDMYQYDYESKEVKDLQKTSW